MKSRITIEVDFENSNSPVLRIAKQQSDDVRDRLLQNFIQQVNAGWITMQFIENANTLDGDEKQIWHIKPLKVAEIPEEIKLMKGVYERSCDPIEGVKKLIDVIESEMAVTCIRNNSTGFRNFLDEKGFKWKGAEHFTNIEGTVNEFQLGIDFEKYKQQHSFFNK